LPKDLVKSGNTHYENHDFIGALKCAESAIAENQKNKYAWLLKGQALREMTMPGESIESFNEALSIDDRFYAAHIEKCAALLALGDKKMANRCVDNALQIHPRLPNAQGWKGFIAYHLGQYQTAISAYKKAISYEKDEKSASIRTNLGDAFLALGRDEQALDCYATASDLDKKDPGPVAAMASFFLNIYADKQKSEEMFLRALKLDKNLVYITWISIGDSLLFEGKLGEAIEYFDKVIGQDSQFESLALINKGLVFYKQGDYLRSIDCFDSALSKASNYSQIAFICKCAAFLKLNKLEEAKKCYCDASKLNNGKRISFQEFITYPDTVGNLTFLKAYDSNLIINFLAEAEANFDDIFDNSYNADSIGGEISKIFMSDEEFSNIKRTANKNGLEGESFVNNYLEYLKKRGQIIDFDWRSKVYRFSAYDFCMKDLDNRRILLDVKSTDGNFDQAIFVSYGELKQMALGKERYDIYRVYGMSGQTAKLQIARDVRSFAQKVLNVFDGLPEGVIPFNISISPASLRFESEIAISASMI
jgi:tetratricopeptide (TPR) repeat protein